MTRCKLSLAVLAVNLATSGYSPAWGDYDAFELPPGIEQTRIPRPLKSGMRSYRSANPEDIRRIEALRASIERYFTAKSYVEAEPLYTQYVGLLEKVGADDSQVASAFQNYAQLLRKLNKDEDANAAEIKANAILTRSGVERQAFGLKEYKLGMTLDDFAKIAPPGTDPKKVKSVCSCDAGQSVESVTPEDKDAKVIKCGFWNLAPDGTIAHKPHALSVANIECEPDFRFVETDGVYRLYEISIAFYNSDFDKIKKALIGKYGEPTGQEVEKLRTEMGRIYPLTNLIWDNGVSKIRLANAEGTNTGRAKLRYIHRQLFLAYAKRVTDAKDSSGKQAATDL